MNIPFEAAYEVGQFLKTHHVPYVVIGGLAVQVWGEARFIKDVDLSISSTLTANSTPTVSF